MTLPDFVTLLGALRVHGDVLPLAPASWDGAAVNRRAQDEAHTCLRCPERAQCVYVAETDAGNRWLDLCPRCAYEMRKELDEYAKQHAVWSIDWALVG